MEKLDKPLMVFSNGVFKKVKGTPWEGIEFKAAFQRLIPKLRNKEIVKHHGREFRQV
jgi:hypothetical protein